MLSTETIVPYATTTAKVHATDDTDLTGAVLLAYRDVEQQRRSPRTTATADTFALAGPVDDVVTRVARYMLDWYDGRWPDRTAGELPCDVGNATEVCIRRFKAGAHVRNSGVGHGQAGNGSLMRCIPTALFCACPSVRPSGWDADHVQVRIEAESMAISAITHDGLRCTIACAAYNTMVHALVHGRTPADAWQAAKDAAHRLRGTANFNVSSLHLSSPALSST
ncbi:ADP-ribosylation/Crystallin J1 [Lasiosphaeria ovina]|uniref:ADP-ribosylation/Crystallin J1 n=1 Tax=Lasiosphaeria ovina TaxID=92902 RepID=A0AAE0JUP9_9PEZI|nr:ADP-ribosylation/Crystallin J1 [Lasiosphaeria ovina]